MGLQQYDIVHSPTRILDGCTLRYCNGCDNTEVVSLSRKGNVTLGVLDIVSGYGKRSLRQGAQRGNHGISNNPQKIFMDTHLHAEMSLPASTGAPLGSNPTRRELPNGGIVIARLFLVISLYAANVQCACASALEPVLSGKEHEAAMTVPGYAWVAPAPESLNSLGTITVTGRNQGSAIPLLSPSIHGKVGALVCKTAQWGDSGKQLKIAYAMGQMSVNVTVAIAARGVNFAATIEADRAVITSVDMGSWPAVLQAQPIAVPYYSANIWYVPKMTAYVNAWWDWHTTHATKLNGTGAQYLARTDGTLSPFHEQLSLVLSPDVDAVLPSPGNPASPFIADLSGRLVLDIWTRDFKKIEHGLIELGDYGIKDCAGIIHLWQHGGYDNALPQHYPANEAMGGDAGLIAAIKAGKADGCLMALHENYVDYYTNYPEFDPSAVALTGDGKWMLSWLNRSNGVQSYSAKPAWMVKNASTQSPAIHARYGTTAAYLDVNSGVSPSSHGDMDARSPGAGTLAAWLLGDTRLWSYERKTHEGPTLGEGRYHWYYSGLLDGVEAQFVTGGLQEQPGTRAPLFVDFDLEQIHPLQVNHGMGYYERWLAPGETISNTLALDAYRMQEIAFGHSPFLGARYWDDVAHAFVESNLVTPVAKSYGVASVSSIEYQVNGAWESPSMTARSAAFSRVRIAYDNGLTIVANGSREPLQWQEMDLPQYGWAAKRQGLLAYTAICRNTICDYAETPTSVFANARNREDSQISEAYATPSVTGFRQISGRRFVITFGWQIHRSMTNNYKAFLHFVNDAKLTLDEGIAFQGNTPVTEPTSHWTPGRSMTAGPVTVQIPLSVADGTYSIRVGLYDPNTGDRVPLAGTEDNEMRYIVGYLKIGGAGADISFKAAYPISDPRLNSAGAVVSFGAVQTDGMVSIREEHGQWVLRPFPRSREFTVLLQRSKFKMPASVRPDGGSTPLLKPVAKGAYWKIPLTGAKSYSWPATNKEDWQRSQLP